MGIIHEPDWDIQLGGVPEVHIDTVIPYSQRSMQVPSAVFLSFTQERISAD